MKRLFLISFLSLIIGILAVIFFKNASDVARSSTVGYSAQAGVQVVGKNNTKKKEFKEKFQSKDILALEGARLYDFSKTTEEVQEVLQKMAQKLSESQIQYLEEVSLNEQVDQDKRLVAMHILTLSGAKGNESLLKMATTPSSGVQAAARPHSMEEMKQKFEFGLRLMALEALERNSLGGEAPPLIDSKILNQITDGRIRRLFGLVLEGRRIHRPLLRKFIDQQIAKVEI